MAVTAFVGVLLLLLSVAAGPAMAEDGASTQVCKCPAPDAPAGSEVCGSDDKNYASQCHLECTAKIDKGLTKASDGSCTRTWAKCITEDCARILVEPSSCGANQTDCWVENLKSKTHRAASCFCGCRTAHPVPTHIHPRFRRHISVPFKTSAPDEFLFDAINVLLRDAALNPVAAQTPQCLSSAIKSAASCGQRCVTHGGCTFFCDLNWYEALCSCRSSPSSPASASD